MRHIYKRCTHCGIRYEYQQSGAGCERPENDNRYCPSCKGVYGEALRQVFAKVPRRYEGRYRNVKEVSKYADVDLKTILRWEQSMRTPKDETRIPIQRIWPGLYNLETGDTMTIREIVAQDGNHKGQRFRLNLWEQTQEHEIKIEMEYDLVEGRFTGACWPF
jgi:hypothetical protein